MKFHVTSQHTIRFISAVEGWGHMCRHVGNGQNYCYSRYVAALQSVFSAIDRMVSAFRRGFGPCLPAGRRMDGDQRDFEREKHSIILSCTCQMPNTSYSLLILHLHPQLDPGPTATIGGMLSTGCSGSQCCAIVNVLSLFLTPPDSQCRPLWHGEGRMVPECGQNTSFPVRQSPIRDALTVLRQTVVLPSGEVIKTRRRSRKSSAGFDTTKLFIGAEGTLGIVTEVTIRLAPVLPTTVATARFPDMRKASEAVIEILNTGIGVRELSPRLSHFSLSFFAAHCAHATPRITFTSQNASNSSTRRSCALPCQQETPPVRTTSPTTCSSSCRARRQARSQSPLRWSRRSSRNTAVTTSGPQRRRRKPMRYGRTGRTGSIPPWHMLAKG